MGLTRFTSILAPKRPGATDVVVTPAMYDQVIHDTVEGKLMTGVKVCAMRANEW